MARGFDQAALTYVNAKNVGVQNLIAECMKNEGFDYTPKVESGMSFSDMEPSRPDDREWVEQFGYGLIYDSNGSYWERSTVFDEMIDFTQVDPNTEYVRSLSVAEHDEYYLTLTGTDLAAGEILSDTGDFSDWENMGCEGYANHEWSLTHPDPQVEFGYLLDEFDEVFAAQYQVIEGPAGKQLDREWSECMATAGYPGIAQQYMGSQSFANASINTVEVQLLDPGAREDAAKIAELADAEIKQALADLDCRESTNYAQRRDELIGGIEAQFIADHRAELDALKAAAEQTFADAPQ
jgi:hypothetical protein